MIFKFIRSVFLVLFETNISLLNMEGKSQKFNQYDYASQNKGSGYVKIYSPDMQLLKCVCQEDDGVGLICFKCGSYTHRCIERRNNRNDQYECASCISKALDPIYTVKQVLIQTYFKTVNIFDYYNTINFQFYVPPQIYKYSIEIRGIKPGSQLLCFPMIGDFYLNNDNKPISEMKPLACNSSRKVRKQEYIILPKQRLSSGTNYLRFKIKALSRAKITPRYQFQQTGIYYISINLIDVIKSKDLVAETLRKRRISQKQSLALLTEHTNDLQFEQAKLFLICPYTGARIKVPVRGKYCKHVGCICLETLITFHTVSRIWGCPLCQNRLNEPYVDMWIDSMLKGNNQKGEVVIIKRDGTYEWVLDKESKDDEEEEIPSPQTPQAVPQEIQSILDEDPDELQIMDKNSEQNQVFIIQDMNENQNKKTLENSKNLMQILKQKMNKSRDKESSLNKQNILEQAIPIIQIEAEQIQEPKSVHSIQASKISSFLVVNNEIVSRQSKKTQNKNKSKTIITDIPQFKYKQISKQTFKKMHFMYQSNIEKKINNFLKLNKELKSIFKQPYS